MREKGRSSRGILIARLLGRGRGEISWGSLQKRGGSLTTKKEGKGRVVLEKGKKNRVSFMEKKGDSSK